MATVMIVDDSRFMREELQHDLEGSAHSVAACCRDAEEALLAYKASPTDLVLMDIVLPGMDGLEATRALVEMGARVVVVSSLGYDDTMEKAQQVGASGFLIKPFNREHLLEALEKAL